MRDPEHNKMDQGKETTMERLCGQNGKMEDCQMGQNTDTSNKKTTREIT